MRIKAREIKATGSAEGADPVFAAHFDLLREWRVYTDDTDPDRVPPADMLAAFLTRYHARVVLPAIAQAVKGVDGGARSDRVAREMAAEALATLDRIGEAIDS